MKNLIDSIDEVAWHRNGVGGRGFYAIRFTAGIEADDGKFSGCEATGAKIGLKWLAVLTDDPGECYVICTDLLETCGVKFAGGNSWRGDHYEPELRKAIEGQDGRHSGAVRVGPFCIPTM
jgi:hypothetical protein